MEKNNSLPLLPGYRINHPPPVKVNERKGKNQSLVYYKNSMYDFPVAAHEEKYDPEQAKAFAEHMAKPTWRFRLFFS